jgi:hypothetical protein
MAQEGEREGSRTTARGQLKAHIGDVVVCFGMPPQGDPYKGSIIGEARRVALHALKYNHPCATLYTFWYAPSSGGARRIKWPEIDWETSGV